jgi:pantoate--beta-alanine ligase
MGFLHEGHLALVRAAKASNDYVAVSIYVNPTQFAPTEDLSTYPRDLERDLDLLREAGVDLVFTPTNEVMYPAGFQTRVEVTEVTRTLEGASRPTHFAGVTLVVAKLFNIIQPTRAYFGQKDAQQVAVLRRMVQDLNFNLELVVCPIVREPDGLAMSSRNKYLAGAERQAALVLRRALDAAEAAVASGQTDAEAIRAEMRAIIAAEPLAKLDYVSLADAGTLVEAEEIAGERLVSLAVFIGRTRLIDNVIISPEG